MKKTIFDVRLYRDGCRQLKVLGMVFGLLMMLEATLLPIYRAIIMSNAAASNYKDTWSHNADLVTLHPAVLFTFTLIVPVLTIYLFQFLNQRNACDFYHSIPQTRTCLCVSYLAASLTWSLGILWGTSFVSMILHAVLRIGYHVLLKECLVQCLSFSIMSLLVTGGILLAMSVTGNPFSNIIVTGMILFVPRSIMLILKLGVGSSVNLVDSDHYLSFLGNGWNLVTSLILGSMVSTISYESLMSSAKAIIYTLILACLYIGLGIWCFRRRSSETAGQAAIDERLQLVFRLIPALMFSLIPTLVLFIDGLRVGGEEIFNLFVLYLIAVIIYFLYELISTRKVRNLKSALPGVAILAILNVVIFLGMGMMKQSILSFTPMADEISSVSLTGKMTNLYMGEYAVESDVHVPGYLTSSREKVELTDPAIRELVAERLAEGVAYDEDPSGNMGYGNRGNTVTVIIRVGNRKEYRQIRLVSSDLVKIGEVLKQNSQVEQIYMELPQANDSNLHLYLTSENNPAEACSAVYEALKEDAKNMGFVKWYAYTSEDSIHGDDYYEICSLNMLYSDGMKDSGSSFPISTDTPKAMGTYMKERWEYQMKNGNIQSAIRSLEELEKMTPEGRSSVWNNVYLNMFQWGSKDGENAAEGYSFAAGDSVDLSNEENIRTLKKLLEAQATLTPTAQNTYISLCLDYELLYSEDGSIVNCYEDMYESSSYYEYLYLGVPDGFDPDTAFAN